MNPVNNHRKNTFVGQQNSQTSSTFKPTEEDIAKFTQLFKKAEEYIKSSRQKDPEYAHKYVYYHVDDMNLTRKIRKSYSDWQMMVEQKSEGKFVLRRESTVSMDQDDHDFFVIALNGTDFLGIGL